MFAPDGAGGRCVFRCSSKTCKEIAAASFCCVCFASVFFVLSLVLVCSAVLLSVALLVDAPLSGGGSDTTRPTDQGGGDNHATCAETGPTGTTDRAGEGDNHATTCATGAAGAL